MPACLLTDRNDVEVIVSDNFSDPETRAVIDRFRSDPRLRAVRTDRRLPMADHWEFAWKHACGDFVIINSDDDVFSPQLLTSIDAASKHIAVGLASWDAGLYLHPDWDLSGANTFKFEANHTGMIFEINHWRIIEAYSHLAIPRCFPLGTRICFARQLGERVRRRVGRLFWAPFPDYSAPLLLLGLLDGHERYLYFDSVLGYGGRSRNSNAAATIPRERGRAGNAIRFQQFFTEHGAENLFGDLEFQGIGLTNGHAQTHGLLRRLLPEVYGRFQLDLVAYIAGVESEFRGINVHNPWLGPEERAQFDGFLARQDREVVKRAMQIVEERWFNDQVMEWRKDWRRISLPAIRYLLRPEVLSRGFTEILKLLLRRRTGLAHVPVEAGPWSSIRGNIHGVMVTVDCESFGGRDGLDLARRLNEIVAVFDQRDARNFTDFFSKDYIRTAYVPAYLLTKSKPIEEDALTSN